MQSGFCQFKYNVALNGNTQVKIFKLYRTWVNVLHFDHLLSTTTPYATATKDRDT